MRLRVKMLEIEFPEPRYSKCDCCGGRSTNLTRFVAKDGHAFAIYHATFGENHPEKGVYLAIGIDEDWGDVESTRRVGFACWINANDSEYQVSITNRVESPWSESKVLGRILDRDEALAHPWIEQVFHLTDHIVEEDPEIKALFGHESIH